MVPAWERGSVHSRPQAGATGCGWAPEHFPEASCHTQGTDSQRPKSPFSSAPLLSHLPLRPPLPDGIPLGAGKQVEAWTKNQAPQVSKEKVRAWVHRPSLLGPEHYSLHPHCPPQQTLPGRGMQKRLQEKWGQRRGEQGPGWKWGRRQVPVPSEKA